MRSVERAVRSVPFRVGYPPTEAWPGDTDFAAARIVGRATEDLASSLGNLANRTLSVIHRYRHGVVPTVSIPDRATETLRHIPAGAASTIDDALAGFDFRRAVEAVTGLARLSGRSGRGVDLLLDVGDEPGPAGAVSAAPTR